MITVNLVIGQNMIKATGFDPRKVASQAAEAANELLKQINWLNYKNSSLQSNKNVSKQSKESN